MDWLNAWCLFIFLFSSFIWKAISRKFVSIEKHEKFDRWFQKNGTFGLFILRLIPLFSFNLLNYGAGLVSITFWQFTWSTALGIIPPMMVMGWLYINSLQTNWGLIILFVLIVSIVLIKIYKKSSLAKYSRRSRG
ncbi:TVP38/TMEM64 family protein (plasmid) [Alkalihalobacillus hwajinpoensis]|uniref:TVP38/TMEM64 family protein n=1 Tax=Guptibacillus hwajinpoensis TaxID=208199 RepID=UPI00188483BC|nr:TVP38/TMEM64 family protein [Pseudalkalibacillus hwajinpoensis]